MRKIGLTLSKNTLEAPLAQHFGKAKWMLIYESAKSFEFVRNDALIGRHVVNICAEKGCTDVIFSHIGWGALRHLREEGIKTWYGPSNVPAQELIACLKRGGLTEALPISTESPHQFRKGRD